MGGMAGRGEGVINVEIILWIEELIEFFFAGDQIKRFLIFCFKIGNREEVGFS